MPRHHHRLPTNRRVELQIPTKPAHTAREVLDAYLRHNISRGTAINKLKESNAVGLRWAGELMVESASQAGNTDQALKEYSRARRLFLRAEGMSYVLNDFAAASRARAQLMCAYLPAIALRDTEHRLPPKHVAEPIYKATVTIGRSLVDSHDQTLAAQFKERKSMQNAADQLSIMALDQRFVLRDNGSETHFPFPRPFSFYRPNNAWDVASYTDEGQGPNVSRLLQVLAGRSTPIAPNLDDGITYVPLVPDLALEPTEFNIGFNILKECLKEMEGSSLASERLDTRTEVYLKLISQSQSSTTV